MTGSISSGAVVRRYADGDLERIVEIYRHAVRTLGPQAYDERQVRMWARFPEDIEAFGESLGAGVTLVAEIDGVAAAFAQLHPADHVQFLYCHGDYVRRGLATTLLRGLEARAEEAGVRRLTTDASRLSRPLFAREGYIVDAVEVVDRFGVSFERFKMAKPLP